MPSEVVRVYSSSGYSARVIRGWRLPSIEQTLDMLASVEGGLYGSLILPFSPSSTASSLTSTELKVEMNRAKWRQQARRKPEIMRANSRRQAEKVRARARLDWDEYCRLYMKKWPGTTPVGFDRWHKTLWKSWKAGDKDLVLFLNRRNIGSAKEALRKSEEQYFEVLRARASAPLLPVA